MNNSNLILACIALLIALTGCNEKTQPENSIARDSGAIKVVATEVKTTDSLRQFKYSGMVEPEQSIALSFSKPGLVSKVYADIGDRVSKGDVLAELDKSTYQSAYNIALATQKQVQDAYERLKKVYEKGSLPEIKWEEIKAKLEQANSSEAMARAALEDTKLIAPRSGIIGSRSIEAGTNIMPNMAVFDLVSVGNVLIKISVPENEIANISPGNKASVNISAINKSNMQARVDKIGVVANTFSKTYEVKLLMPNPGYNAKPGMACDVTLSISSDNNVLLIPYQSVMQSKDGDKYVYVVDMETMTVSRKIVTTGGFEHNSICVLEGLAPGELVIVSGQEKLKDNSKVTM